MKDELLQNQEWVELKATLRFVEDKILGITDSDNNWMLKKDLCEQVKELLRDRYTIMKSCLWHAKSMSHFLKILLPQ